MPRSDGSEGGRGVAFGNAVLSRWPITDSAWEALPAVPGADEGRTVLRATVASPYGVIPFFTTQLASAWGHSLLRQEQVAAICRLVAEHDVDPAFPPVLTGDFNATPDGEAAAPWSARRPRRSPVWR